MKCENSPQTACCEWVLKGFHDPFPFLDFLILFRCWQAVITGYNDFYLLSINTIIRFTSAGSSAERYHHARVVPRIYQRPTIMVPPCRPERQRRQIGALPSELL